MGREICKETLAFPLSAYSTGMRYDHAQGSCKHTSSNEPRDSQASPTAAGFSMGQRFRATTNQDDKRGPGAYISIWEKSHGPAFSFHGKRSAERKSEFEGPGPGEYSSALAFRATKSSAPAYSMGARCGPSAFSTLDLGAYDNVKDRSNCVASTKGYKSRSYFSLVPGPGSYNSDMKPSGPAFSMGMKENRRDRVNRFQSPGPGAYDVSRKNSGPSFSIAPKVRQPVTQRDSNPGPGTYTDNLYNSLNRGVAYTIRERLKSNERVGRRSFH